jgi:hypothetical protein
LLLKLNVRIGFTALEKLMKWAIALSNSIPTIAHHLHTILIPVKTQ